MKLTIKNNIILAPYTAFKIGGPARFFCEVSGKEDLNEALEFAQNNNLAVFILGGGSNILVNGAGFNGLVIRILNTKYHILDTKIECGAGLSLSELVNLAKNNSFAGLEWAAGIPGTVGGAINGNAGAYGSEMGKVLKSLEALDFSDKNPKLKTFSSEDCKFGYRDSIFKQNPELIILSCSVRLQRGGKSEIGNKMQEIIRKRAEKLPKKANAGSIFKNPVVGNIDIIERFKKDGGKMDGDKIPAGWLIEEVGLKGKKIGQAEISNEHANVIVNNGNATAQDVVGLISLIKMKVRDELGVELKEEIKYVGF